MAELLEQKIEVNQETGHTGCALIAASISGSVEVVGLLLVAGAHPMMEVNGHRTAVSVAATFPGEFILDMVLEVAFKHSVRRASDFQRTIDGALYEATSSDSLGQVMPLLIVGANPVSPQRGTRTSLGVAFRKQHDQIISFMLATMWERYMLTEKEVRGIMNAAEGALPTAQSKGKVPPVPYEEISLGNTSWLQDLVQQRLGQRRHGIDTHGLYFRTNINNPRCRKGMLAFWQWYQDELFNAYDEPDLVGIA